MDNIDSDLLRQCPFDPMHQVRSSRYEIHVSKCKRVKLFSYFFYVDFFQNIYVFIIKIKNYEINNNNKKANIDICPFNFKHQFVGNTLAAFENHKNSCPDRFRLRNEVEIGLFLL
jgi:hypothetical protein